MAVDLTKTSSLAAGCNSAYQAMIRCGKDPGPALAAAGLRPKDLANPDARIDSQTHLTFIESAFKQCGEPAFGLLAADFIHPTSYHNWGLALLSSSTLSSYLNRWERFYSLISTHMRARVIHEQYRSRIQWEVLFEKERFPGAYRAITEANLAVALKYIRLRCSPDYQPLRAELTHRSAQGRKKLYQQYLGDHIVFGADAPSLWFRRDEMDRRLPSANSELARKNDEVLMHYMAKMDRANIPNRTRAQIVKLLPSGECSKAAVARALNMSPRTLQNRLAEADTSFRELMDQVRRELGGQYLRQSDKSTIEVAFLLGFADHSSFSRAFHRWTGRSPSEYRAQHA